MSSLRIRAIIRLYHKCDRRVHGFCERRVKTLSGLHTAGLKKLAIRNGSAHAAVGRPVHLGHLASDDISLETPEAYPPRAFSQDDIMTSW